MAGNFFFNRSLVQNLPTASFRAKSKAFVYLANSCMIYTLTPHIFWFHLILSVPQTTPGLFDWACQAHSHFTAFYLLVPLACNTLQITSEFILSISFLLKCFLVRKYPLFLSTPSITLTYFVFFFLAFIIPPDKVCVCCLAPCELLGSWDFMLSVPGT